MGQQTQEVQRQLAEFSMEVQRLRSENDALRQNQAAGSAAPQGAATTAVLQALVAEVRQLRRKSASATLVDNNGLGKPSLFTHEQVNFSKWARSMGNYVVGVFGEEFRPVLEWAIGCEGEISRVDLSRACGEEGDDLDQKEDLDHKNNHLYLALMALTNEETQD